MKSNLKLALGLILIILSISLVALNKQGTKNAKAQTSSFRFAVYSDSQQDYASSNDTLQRSVNAIKNKVPNTDRAFLIGLGDFTQNGHDTEATANYTGWSEWKSAMNTLITDWNKSPIPQHIGIWGDHDRDRDNNNWLTAWSGYMSAQKGLTAYSSVPSDPNGLYGSFKYQNSLFVWLAIAKIEDEQWLPSGLLTAQEAYLTKIIDALKADPTPPKWKFAFYHNGVEACGISGKPDIERAKVWLNNFFVPNGFDMVFSGDTHSYLRTCPMTYIAPNVGGATTCENFDFTKPGDPNGVIEILSTPITASTPISTEIPACAPRKSDLADGMKRSFTEININGDVLDFKAWNIDDATESNGEVIPVLMDSLKIDKSVVQPPTPISLDKSASATRVKKGDIITYTLSYTAGNQTYTTVKVTDRVPDGTQFLSASNNGSLIDGVVTWSFSDFTPGETGDLTFQVKVL